MFYIVFELEELFISLEPDVWLRWDLDQNVAFEIDKWSYWKIKTENCRHVTHSPWSCHIWEEAFFPIVDR